ncbi:MAG: hypothetical protein SNG10_03230 [Rikenellaceae bacterium]
MYLIEVENSYEQLWRYNTIVMCGGYSPSPENAELYVVSTEDIISQIETPIEGEPAGYKLPRRVNLEAAAADHIRVIVYLVAHTLPLGREVSMSPAFDLEVKISKDSEVVYNTTHKVNQWGGASIEIKL